MEHGAGGPAWAALLEHSSLVSALRGSLWLYPAVECPAHRGLRAACGLDCQLRRPQPARPLAGDGRDPGSPAPAGGPHRLRARRADGPPPPRSTEATAYVANPAFLTKLVLIALALANIAWFHHRLKAAGETFGVIGLGRLRFSAGLSLGLWICRAPGRPADRLHLTIREEPHAARPSAARRWPWHRSCTGGWPAPPRSCAPRQPAR